MCRPAPWSGFSPLAPLIGVVLGAAGFEIALLAVVSHIDGRSAVDQVYLCHSICALGKRRLLDGLCDVTRFQPMRPPLM